MKRIILAALSIIYIYIYTIVTPCAWALNDATSFSPEKVQVQAQSIGVPVGTVIVWTKNAVPDGWLECNGQKVNKTLYPDLAALMQNTPNYKGRFLQGSTNPGEVKEAGLPNITGRYDTFNNSFWGNFTIREGAFKKTTEGQYIAADIASLGRGLNVIFDASMSNPIYGKSNTVQPPAVTVKYIIKAE